MTGSDNPPTLNTELLVFAAVTVTFAPLAVRVPEALLLVPTTTLPNDRVVGETDNCPIVTVPVPETGIVRVGFDAVELTVTVPLTLPAACGANETLKFALCPPASVSGVLIPAKLKPLPVIPT